MTDEEIKEKANELTIKNVTDGKNKYFSWGFYKGCVVGLEYNNKQIAELEEKISVLLSCKKCPENKGGWICVKEYENKCLAQKIVFIQELKKENAELKKELKISQRCWQDQKNISLNANCSLHKAKEIIKDFILMAKVEHLKDRYETVDEAEQFLNSEVE